MQLGTCFVQPDISEQVRLGCLVRREKGLPTGPCLAVPLPGSEWPLPQVMQVTVHTAVCR